MLALKPRHQTMIAATVHRLPQEKRQTFVDRIAGRLRLRQFQSTCEAISDADLVDEIERALRGLVPNSAA
jgi:hypothetical protein